jgi:hypothetical protein
MRNTSVTVNQLSNAAQKYVLFAPGVSPHFAHELRLQYGAPIPTKTDKETPPLSGTDEAESLISHVSSD